MGFFDRTRTIIDSSSSRLYEDVPGILEQTITTSIVQNRNLAEDLVTNIINNKLIKAKSMREYGKHHYTYGLPNGDISYVPPASKGNVEIIIEGEVGNPVQIDTLVIDEASADYYAAEFMMANRGLDFDTGQVINPPFATSSDVYVKGAAVLGTNRISITYSYQELEGTPPVMTDKEYTEQVTVSDLVPRDLYYMVTYFDVIGDIVQTQRKFWKYRVATNKHPTLGSVDSLVEDSPYFPIVPIREHQVDLTAPDKENTELYKTSKQCLRLMQLDIKQLGDAVHGREAGDAPDYVNPDVKDVDHAYVVLGVDVADDHEAVIAYLWEYFHYLQGHSQVSKIDYEYWYHNNRDTATPPINRVEIHDANYRMALGYSYITSEIKNGNIGKVDKVKREIEVKPNYTTNLFRAETSVLKLTKQISPTQVHVLEVVGLIHTNYVYSDATVNTGLAEAMDSANDKNNFIIPMHLHVVENLGVFLSHEALIASVRIVFNTKVEKKLKWYETGFFKIFLTIVTIVLTATTGGLAGAIWPTLTGMGLVVANIAVGVALAIVAKVAITVVADIVGMEAALILAAIATAVTGYGAEGLSFAMPTAMEMLNIALTITQLQLATEYQSGMEAINKEMEMLQEEKEELEELMDVGLSDPLALLANTYTFDVFRDSPTNYYEQAVHQGNPGVLSLNAVELFTQSKVKLDLPATNIRTRVD